MAGHGREPEQTANGAHQSANGGAWHPLRALGEVAARPPEGGRGPGRSGGTGPRGTGHRGWELRSPRLERGLATAVIIYNLVIGRCIEVLPPTVLILHSTCVVCPLFTHVKALRRLKAREGGDHR